MSPAPLGSGAKWSAARCAAFITSQSPGSCLGRPQSEAGLPYVTGFVSTQVALSCPVGVGGCLAAGAGPAGRVGRCSGAVLAVHGQPGAAADVAEESLQIVDRGR